MYATGIYRSRCVGEACDNVLTTFAPMTTCPLCGLGMTLVEFRPEGTEGEDETIQGLYEDVLAGLDGLLSAS